MRKIHACFNKCIILNLLVYYFALASLPVFAQNGQPAAQQRPNILFILTDDQRWDALGCYGNRSIQTPNLDLLAKEGARLDAFYAGAPLCCPSRAAFLTGLFPHQTGVVDNHGDIPRDIPTVATLLNEAGYITGFVGKAHLGGNPPKWGFTECPMYFPQGSIDQKIEGDIKVIMNGAPRDVKALSFNETIADQAVTFLEKHKKDRWFLWLATTAPHVPFLAYPKYAYDPANIAAPPGWPPSEAFNPTNKKYGNWADYYSTVTMLDDQIGKVLKKLNDLHLDQNTFIFFASDNGYMFGSHHFDNKRVWFEESVRLPALARWPSKIKPGTRVPTLLSNIDFVATIAEVGGVKRSTNFSIGKSMLPALMGREPERQYVFSEVKKQGTPEGIWQMVRSSEYKFVRFTGGGPEFFYNLKTDPHEKTNEIDNKEFEPVIQQYKQRLDEWVQQTPANPQVKLKEEKKKSEQKNRNKKKPADEKQRPHQQ